MDRPTIPLPSKRILIVEDHKEVREILAQVLEIEDYFVFQAKDGAEALRFLDRIMPDLILSDIEMPNMNGLEFFSAVRKLQSGYAVPFIFLTSHNSPDLIQACRAMGVQDFLTKPVDTAVLVKTVNARLLRAAELQVAYMDQAYLEMVNVLANTIETRDPYTQGHVERLARYARWLAEPLDWPLEHMRRLEFGARLHDVGKIVVPDHILKKPGPLTDEEWELMKQHPIAGARILSNISNLQSAIPFVLYHHERWDGTGYPRGLKGREIPLEGRLLAIVDVYDALTTDRPFHPARPVAEVLKYLSLRSGHQFDPELINLFLQVIQKHASELTEDLSKPDSRLPMDITRI